MRVVLYYSVVHNLIIVQRPRSIRSSRHVTVARPPALLRITA